MNPKTVKNIQTVHFYVDKNNLNYGIFYLFLTKPDKNKKNK